MSNTTFQPVKLWSGTFTNHDYTYVNGIWHSTPGKSNFARLVIHDITQTGPDSYRTRFDISTTSILKNKMHVCGETKYDIPTNYTCFKTDSHQNAINHSIKLAFNLIQSLNSKLIDIMTVLNDTTAMKTISNAMNQFIPVEIIPGTIIEHTKTVHDNEKITINIPLHGGINTLTLRVRYNADDAELLTVITGMHEAISELTEKIATFYNMIQTNPETIMQPHHEIFGNTGCWYNKDLNLTNNYHS